ncbi:MAG: HAD-IIIA family hydrolase [Brevinema sp.]
MKNVAFIPLRGGSQSIPLKNIKLLNGRPLCYYVIDAADQCLEIDTIVISTDSDEIRAIVQSHPSTKILVIDRSSEVSSAEASTESTMIEFTDHYTCETIILIQATSPLLKSDHLAKGLSIYYAGADSVLSIVRRHNFVWSKNGTPLNYDPQIRPRRQDWDGILVENGAFYITSYEGFKQSRCRLNGRIAVSEMPPETFVEIDEENDWVYVESILNREYSKNQVDLSKIKIFLTDCDGTLTDSGMYYAENGELLKKFNTRDGHAFQMLNEAGIITGIITGENSSIVQARGLKIKAQEIHLGIKNKQECVQKIVEKYHCSLDEVAFVGDDFNDVSLLKTVGFAAVPADAIAEAKTVAHYISSLKGGEGAVRDVVEYFLRFR